MKRPLSGYDAFISYSHAADGKLAPRIQQSLRALAKPWYRLRALHVFRDETSLTANPALWPSIERALAQSRWFVYLASPRAARSAWVKREITWWLSHRDPKTLLLALTDGVLQWDQQTNQFDWRITNALPAELSGHFSSEPLWVDLSWARDVDQMSLRHSQFRAAILQLAAPMHDRAPDELDGEDVRQYRRTRRTAGGAIVGLAGLTVAATTAAYLAVKRSRESASRELATHAVQQLETDPELGLRLALHAIEAAQTPQAEDALRAALAESSVRLTVSGGIKKIWPRFTPDGETLVLANDRTIVVVNKSKVQRLECPGISTPVQFSGNAKVMAAGGSDGKARVWDIDTGRMVTEIQVADRRLVQVGLSADGSRLATMAETSQSESESVDVWDTRNRAHLAVLDRVGLMVHAQFDENQERIRTARWFDDIEQIWSVESGELLQTIEGKGRAAYVEALGDTSFLSTNSDRYQPDDLGEIDSEAMKRIQEQRTTGPELTIYDDYFAVLSSSKRLMLVYENTTAVLYDARTGQKLRALRDVPGSVSNAVFSDNDRRIAVPCRDGSAVVWDAESGERIATFRGHKGDLNEAAFGPGGKILITSGSDRTSRVWVVDHRPQALILRGHAREISDAIWSPDGKLVATASSDQTVNVWDSQTGELLSTSTCPGPVSSVLFSKDSLKLLMVIHGAGGARICETRSGRVLVHLTDPLAPHQVFRLANWSPDESIVVAATQDSVLRWNAHSGDALDRIAMATAGYTPGYSRGAGLICTSTGSTSSSICRVDDRSIVSGLNDHLKNVIHCVLSRDGRFVALAAPSSAQVWETLTGRLICRLAGEQEYINSIEFSCNGERLITAGGEPDPVGRIWDTTSGRLLGELRGHVHAIGSARFSSDGQLIVTSSQDNTARLWRADACRTIAILRGHSDLIFDARFCPDNQRILTSSADCTARIFDVSLSRSPAELMQMARARLPRQLTADEAAQFLH